MKQNTSYQVINDLQGYMSLEQVEAIINATTNDRDRLLLRLLSRTGRRITEVIGRKSFTYENRNKGIFKDYPAINGIRPMDISWQDKMIAFNILKKKKPLRKLKPIDNKTLDMLKDYITRNNIEEDQEIFDITRRRVDQIIKRAARKAGIIQLGERPVHAHHFRHTFAIQTLKHGKSSDTIKKVQMALEHSSLAVTSGYLQFDQKELKTLLEDTFQDDKQSG